MIEILGIDLQNVVYFKSAKVRLDKNNLTFIRGLNSDGDPANPTGNGAGKSLLFSTIPNLFFFAPPLSIRKKSSKELLGSSSSVKILMKTANGVKHSITQKANGFQILENGEDLKLRTKPLAEKYIKSIFPLSDVEFYTHCFVSTQRPFVMQTDSNIARMEHLSTIFKLDDFDSMRQMFMQKISAIKDSEVKLQVLLKSESVLKAKIITVAANLQTDVLAESKAELEELDVKLNDLVRREFSLLKSTHSAEALLSIEKKLDALRVQYKSKERPETRLKWLKLQRKAVTEQASYLELLQAYKSSVKSIEERIAGLELPDATAAKCKSRLVALTFVREKIEAGLNECSDKERMHKRSRASVLEIEKRALSDYGVDVHQGHEFGEDADFSEQISEFKSSMRLNTLLHDHDFDGTCPTCLSTVDIDNIKTVVATAKKKLPALERAQAVVAVCAKWQLLADEHAELRYDAERHASLRSRQVAALEELEATSAAVNTWKKHKYLTNHLANIVKPVAPKCKPETDLSLAELETEVELCSEIVSNLAAKSSLYDSNKELENCRTAAEVKKLLAGFSSSLLKIEKNIGELKTKKADLSGIVEVQTAHQNEFRIYSQELASVQKQVGKLSPLLEDRPVLEVLIKAYSSKGLKTLRANEICSILETNLNHYRGLIFSEPFQFALEASESGLSIMVDRGNDKVSDVRSLSGAESNCFRLLFILSLLPLIPSDRRLNLLILDEPTAHMHAVTRQIFVERYLPAITELVPNTYVITPNSDEYVKGASEWIVSKKDGESKLISN